MKILHTITSLGIKSGGTATCTYDLVNGLNEVGYATDILTLDTTDPNDILVGNDTFVKVLPNDSLTGYIYSKNFKRALLSSNNYSIYHLNGMWQYIQYISAYKAKISNKPYIITPHGMLYPQALLKSKLKKKIIMSIQFKRLLLNASCIHATCNEELKYYRELGFKNPVAVIPNPTPIPNYINTIKSIKDKRRIGFLGRLHPRKNVLTLIRAWAKLGSLVNDDELLIMGNSDTGYENILKNEVLRLKLDNVIFVGLVEGRNKFEKLATLTALVVPSDFENFGMIVTEALMMKVPVISSKGTPWEELIIRNCGWWIDNDIDTIANTIATALSLTSEELRIMGINGRQLVYEKYHVDVVAQKMINLYKWVLHEGDRPDFVTI